VLEVAAADAQNIAVEVARIMEDAVSLSVRLKVDFGIGNNWDEAH